MSFSLSFHQTIHTFMDAVGNYLLKFETESCLSLGLMDGILSGNRCTTNPLFISVHWEGQSVGSGMRVHPKAPLLLSRMPEAAIGLLAKELKSRGIEISEVQGIHKVTTPFATHWSRLNDVLSTVKMSQGLYQVDEVIMPDLAGGQIVMANGSHRDRAIEFMAQFVYSVDPNEPSPESRGTEIVDRCLEENALFFWQDRAGTLVSAAARVRRTSNGASISLVYTPEVHRRKGHGSRVVAALSQHLIDTGKSFCNLFTDLDNPTSNSIYQKIGYRRVATCRVYSFEPKTDPLAMV